MTGVLTVIAGSPASPAIQFTGSTNTGFSAATPNRLSFDTNGTERMSIEPTGNIVTASALILTNLLCNQSIQTLTTAINASVSADASILIINASANVTVTITFPDFPTNGQLFTILSANNNTITLINNAGSGGATFPNSPITSLQASSILSSASVTYIYDSSLNVWLRIMRG